MRSLGLLLWLAASGLAQITGASQLLPNAGGENQALSGVGRFQGPSSCTAFLIDTGRDDVGAYALTAGHCISTNSANEVLLDRPVTATIRFQYFRDTPDRQLPVPVRRVVYSTMKGLDVAVLRLEPALAALRGSGIAPLRLASNPPVDGERVRTVGVPFREVPSDEVFLRQAHCVLEPPVDLIENFWTFRGALPNACPDIRAGSSGSPVLNEAGDVVALINTTTAGAVYDTGDFPCSNGQPCEIAPGGYRYRRETNYAVPLDALAACFENGEFALATACPLDAGRQLRTSLPPRGVRPGTPWNVQLSSDTLTHYRYKVVAQGAGDCREDADYGEPVALSAADRIVDPLPQPPGIYHLCLIAGAGEDWQPAAQATMVHTRVDTTPPTIPMPYVFRDEDDLYVFEPIFVVPELVDYRYKVATDPGDTCAIETGYRTYLRIPIRIPKRDQPYRLCFFGRDFAGNATPPVEIPLAGTALRPDGVRNAASYQGGPFAPGSWLSLFGVNLSTATPRLTDSAGRQWMLEPSYASAGQINAWLPVGVAPGRARLDVGSSSLDIGIGPGRPGIFSASQSGNGAAAGVLIRPSGTQPLYECASPLFCTPAPWDPPAHGETIRVVFYATGVAGAATARLSGMPMDVVSMREEAPGVMRVEFLLDETFPLRGFLPLTLDTPSGASPAVFVRVRDTTGR